MNAFFKLVVFGLCISAVLFFTFIFRSVSTHITSSADGVVNAVFSVGIVVSMLVIVGTVVLMNVTKSWGDSERSGLLKFMANSLALTYSCITTAGLLVLHQITLF